MKITKRQLRRIIKEERAKLLKEQGNPGAAGQDEAAFLADFSMTMDAIKEIAAGMYGLIDPADAGLSISAGDDMANDLELQVERLNDLYTKFERHLEYGGNLLTPQ
jgi:hypothetical protein